MVLQAKSKNSTIVFELPFSASLCVLEASTVDREEDGWEEEGMIAVFSRVKTRFSVVVLR